MTEYNGQTITYDKIGNPLTYRDGMTMTWKRGRQLTTLQTEENSIQYKYDSDSIRTSKIVNGVVHTYEYLNGLLMHETRGEQAYDYYYDANGQLYAVSYKLSETDIKKVYYFTNNWRGDIVGIYNGNGDLKATYEYDAWGNVVSIEDANGNAITGATHIANLNPFRYRGYYMDTETGLYYLMSRYYDPVTHRFVNADGYFQSGGTLLDTNMNAYCRNNPINCFDPTGNACKEHGRFYVPNCTYCSGDRRDYLNSGGINYYNEIHGTNYIGVNDSGDFLVRTFTGKVVDSIGAAFFSLRLDLDVGLGIGGKVEAMEMIGITGIFEQYAYYLSFNANGIDYGTVEYSGIGLQLGSWDVISSGHKTVHSSVTGETTENYQDEHIIGFVCKWIFCDWWWCPYRLGFRLHS